jgi:hypothetical protein
MLERRMSRSCFRLLSQSVAIAGLVFGLVGQAQAAPAFTLDNTIGFALGVQLTVGSEFSTSVPIIVTGLGVLDDEENGLVESHAVGIWNGSGTLVASGTVASGTIDPLINQFRYDTIASVLLAPGDYRIGALYTSGLDRLIIPGFANNFATAPGIAFLEAAHAEGSSLSDPIISDGTSPGWFGPNFTFVSASVPEPASLALLGSGLVGLVMMRRRKASSHAPDSVTLSH